MLTRRCENNFEDRDFEDREDHDVEFEELIDNIGRVITVFTKSGGCSGRGFTGLLVKVNRKFIKLVSSFPSAPRHPFGRDFDFDFDDFRFRHRDCEKSRFGTVIIIPIRDIVAFVFNEV